jgi:hypothetical protein
LRRGAVSIGGLVVSVVAVIVQAFCIASIVLLSVRIARIRRFIGVVGVRCEVVGRWHVLAHRCVVQGIGIRMATRAQRHASVEMVLTQAGATAHRYRIVPHVFVSSVATHTADGVEPRTTPGTVCLDRKTAWRHVTGNAIIVEHVKSVEVMEIAPILPVGE